MITKKKNLMFKNTGYSFSSDLHKISEHSKLEKMAHKKDVRFNGKSIKRYTRSFKKPYHINFSQNFREHLRYQNRLTTESNFLNKTNRLMSEELLSNNRRVEKHLTTPGFEQLTSRSLTRSTAHSAIGLYLFLCYNRFLY